MIWLARAVAAQDLAEPAPSGSRHYLPANRPDAAELLAAPPLPGSPEQAADLQEVQAVYYAAGSNDVAAAQAEKKFNVFSFCPAVGAFFESNNLPRTAVFFRKVQTDAAAAADQAKEIYRRPRPYTVDPTLANGKLEKSFSYPSGHASEAMVMGLVLAEVFPERKADILGHARAIGWHRVQIARHYPTDIFAGRALAQAIVRQMEASPEFRRDLAAVKSEVLRARELPVSAAAGETRTRVER